MWASNKDGGMIANKDGTHGSFTAKRTSNLSLFQLITICKDL
jgi:hypothetical protein